MMRNSPPAKRINREESRQRKDKIEDANPHAGEQGGVCTVARIGEDCRGIVCNDIDSAKLLHKH